MKKMPADEAGIFMFGLRANAPFSRTAMTEPLDTPEPMTRMRAFWCGALAMFGVPALVLYAGILGYGAFAREAGLTLGQTLALPIFLQALPAQVVLADHAARGASLAAAALAVSLTAVRFLPMTVVLMPWIKGHGGPRWHELLVVHFVAVTVWIEGLRRLPSIQTEVRLVYYLGIGIGILTGTLISTALGYLAAGMVPQWMAAALLFTMPLTFLLAMIETARARTDLFAIVAGVVIAPFAYLWVPGFDLLVTGLAGGTIAWLLGRWGRA
jgi:predicted branched-subunit amino acid permease